MILRTMSRLMLLMFLLMFLSLLQTPTLVVHGFVIDQRRCHHGLSSLKYEYNHATVVGRRSVTTRIKKRKNDDDDDDDIVDDFFDSKSTPLTTTTKANGSATNGSTTVVDPMMTTESTNAENKKKSNKNSIPTISKPISKKDKKKKPQLVIDDDEVDDELLVEEGGDFFRKLPIVENDMTADTTNENDRNDDESSPSSSSTKTTEEEEEEDDDEMMIIDMGAILDKTFVMNVNTEQVPYLLSRRSYARPGPFAKENMTNPIDLEDLLPQPSNWVDTFYYSLPAGIITFGLTFWIFPHITNLLVLYMDSNPKDLDEIVSKLVPGITIMYGTFISLTLNILYNRQRFVQDSVAQETSMLSFLLQNMVSLFRRDRPRMVRSGQASADQVGILLRETRGQEYMTVVYADPYTKLLHLVEEEEERMVREHGDFLSKGPILQTCRDTIRDLRKYRSIRLSDESLGLPETHFNLLKMMTGLILMGYVVAVLPAVEDLGYTPIESRVLFSILSVVYLLFYSVARDLNDLYNGVFQLRKGSAACHLLEIKKICADHPWLRSGVDFERDNQEARCFAPEMTECWLE